MRNAADEGSALIFGNIDLTETDRYLLDVSFDKQPEQVVRVTMKRWTNDIKNVKVYDNSMFLAENVKPGDYIFTGFHTKMADFNVKKDPKNVIAIKPGSIHYIGSYKYKKVKSNRLKLFFLGEGNFGLEKADSPGELDLLVKILKYTKGTTWEPKIQARINKLSKMK